VKPGRAVAALASMAIGGMWLGITPGHATSMKPMNLAHITGKARQIVVGTVASVKPGKLGSLPYVEIEVKVSETLRGMAQPTLKFKQLDTGRVLDPENGRRYLGALPGMPHYVVGEQVLLFLGAPTSNSFRTTIGLQQGKLTLSAGNAANEMNNRGLFRNVSAGSAPLDVKEQSMLATSQGMVNATTLIGLVRRAVAGKWWDPVTPAPPPGGGRGNKRQVAAAATEGATLQ